MFFEHGDRLTAKRARWVAVVFVAVFPALVDAQETPKVEAFGGYSYLGLSQQPRLRFESAALNGWKGSLKLNLTQRIGILADFSGHYGNLAITPNGMGRLSVSRRQHTYLFGLETQIFSASRVELNARALLGVSQTSHSTLPQWMPPVAGSVFAAAFGASVDYRITDRLSYRILEPELLVTRLGSATTNNWQQYNLRLSSGLVFSSGKVTSSSAGGRRFSFGVVGGAALTDAFDHESAGFILVPGGGTQPTRFRSYSTMKDYVIGPMVDAGLPFHGLSVEIGALYCCALRFLGQFLIHRHAAGSRASRA
jgi:hypothetical protein